MNATAQKSQYRQIPTMCFTGHRPQSLPGKFNESHPGTIQLKDTLARYIEAAYVHNGTRIFVTGMALGIDQWAAEAVMSLKRQYSDIKLIAAVPFLTQYAAWKSAASRKRWETILCAADRVFCEGEETTAIQLLADLDQVKQAYKSRTYVDPRTGRIIYPLPGQDYPPEEFAAMKLDLRNQFMVDNSQAVMAVWNGFSGGTGNCVNYARRFRRPIFIINPISGLTTKEG